MDANEKSIGLFLTVSCHNQKDLECSSKYLSDQATNLSFRAHALDADREDIFLFIEQTLYHTAIVKYGR
ncbi:MAG: hypothetical protein EBW37_08335, partial [Rhodobacteraceae bacterium]|nr:hypothetical protein [Paracoccaceae bacterium]